MTTVSKRSDAKRIAKTLIEQRIAACCIIMPKAESHFHWDGKRTHAHEYVLLCKAPRASQKIVRSVIASMHPYAVPAIITWQAHANDVYAAWAQSTCLQVQSKKEVTSSTINDVSKSKRRRQ